jgi:hypothetical protein
VVIAAGAGFELLAAYRLQWEGRRWWEITSSPIVAWRIVGKARPKPIPLKAPDKGALSVAIKQPGGSIVELAGRAYEDRGAWLRTLRYIDAELAA